MKKYIKPSTTIVTLNVCDSILQEGAGMGTSSQGAMGSCAMSKKQSFLLWDEEETQEEHPIQQNLWE